MKGKIPKVLGVSLVLALVLSFSLVAAVPVAALGQPTVTVSPATISAADADYTIIFTLGEELIATGDTITITFPDDTTVAASVTATILASPGWFSADANTAEGWQDSLQTSTVTWSSDATARTVTATLADDATEIGQAATVQISITAGITNPSAVGDYTLTVKTSQETTAVESASYSITAPVLGGTVEVFNPSDVLMATYSGATALNDANAGTYYGEDNYTIEVGPGTYTLADTIDISGEGLTFKSTDGAEVTIIDASALTSGGFDGAGILIDFDGDDVTVDGFTIEDAGACGIYCRGDDAIIQNNVVTFEVETGGIDVPWTTTGVTVSGNELNEYATMIVHGSDCTVSGNTFGCALNLWPQGGQTLEGVTISDNIFPANTDYGAINLMSHAEASVINDSLIEGNTISNRKHGIWIGSDNPAYLTVTNLVITGNDITDNDGVGIVVGSWTAASDAIKFNNITGNDTTNGYGIETNLSGIDVDATHNWWGTSVASEVAAMVNDTGTGVTDYTPFLSDTVDAVFSATALDTSVASLDAEDEVGVKVSTTNFTTNYVISAAEYIDNPGAPLDNALAFYDVYVTGVMSGTDDEVVVKFYADGVDEDSVVYAWNELYDTWQECDPQDFSFWGGYAYVTIHAEADTDDPTTPTIEALTGLPFAISGEVAPPPFDPWDYDDDEDGEISKTEALNAIVDYFEGDITKDEALQVIALYFAS